MYELPRSDFARLNPLIDSIRFYRPSVFTVLEGTQPGRVFVDRVNDPRAVVMLADFCYLGGSPDALDLPSDVTGLLESEMMAKSEYLLMVPLNESWKPLLETIVQPYETKFYQRSIYSLDAQRYRELNHGWQGRLPPGFSLRRADAALALEIGGIPDLWGSVENFLANGFAFCMVDEAQPDLVSGFASSAQTVFVGDRCAETGVETREAYRRRGLATAVCCAFIDHCLQNGIQPIWGCVENEASEKLAYKLGFGDRQDWPLLLVRAPERLRARPEG